MWKDALLQIMISLLPVFGFQMWFNRPDRSRGIPIFMGGLCLLAMLLGVLISRDSFEGYQIDFQMVPFVLGSLYGGFAVALLLSVIYLAVQAFLITNFWEYIEFLSFLLLAMPLIFIAVHRFKLLGRSGKQKLAVGLGGLLVLLNHGILALQLSGEGRAWDEQFIAFLVFSFIGFMLLIWIAVILIESVIEKQQLQDQLQRMSTNYRNEVQKLQQFIDMIPMGVVIVDAGGEVTHLNEAALQVMGSSLNGIRRQELVGRSIAKISDTFMKETAGKLLFEALNGEDTASSIVETGSRTYINTGFGVRDLQSQDIIGAALIVHDITEISHLRDEFGRMERLSLVGQMAASITHEIRNPMAVIRGFIQLMKERSPEHHRDYYRIVMDELDRANAIINDFLSLAQNRIVHKEKSSLNHIVRELVQLLWADANLRGQTIEIELDETLPMLEINEKEIKQLILNLARNGMEAMGNNGVLVLRTRLQPNMIQLQVADSGCGIPKEKMERLFEPFYTTKTRGTGLGLPLCLSIVERHQGKIAVDSDEGEGTVFTVSFQIS
ncbi:ATP-binding protein [Paenibacillus pinihumi]|uniref:ATP-binding protein n=1 Tax=Paenibacillus pinihumi TaxID=669462 RepID=UPI0012B6339B|nr:ATP-binding protein [Paenibacillus pinihumi]